MLLLLVVRIDHEATAAGNPGMKILAIEDDPSSLELLELRLGSLDCEVITANSGAEGFRLARREQPHLIILDVRLTDGEEEGYAVLERLAADETTCRIPVVLHSIYIVRKSDLPSTGARLHGFLRKPFQMADLRRLIGELRGL